MKKIILLYILMIILIAGLAILMNRPWEIFSLIKFPPTLHVIIEGANSLLMFLIFLVSNYLYSKAKDERLLILAGGFLVGSILNSINIITVKAFPYDLLSMANLQNNPTIVYLLLGNLILPLAIYFSLLHKPSQLKLQAFRLKVYSIYFFIFLALTTFPLLIHYFLPYLTVQFHEIMHAIEFINYSLYIMLAFIVINIRQASNLTFFPAFTLGLIILGLGGLFYINPLLVQANEILAHIFQALGLMFMLVGIPRLQTYALFLRFKDELVAYLCLLLISFYIVFISTTSVLFHITFPPFSAYIFIEFILIFQFIVYLMSNKLTQPVTTLIETLSVYNPGEEPIIVPVIRRDEIGRLTDKINAASTLAWQKISEISQMAERERSIIRVFEAMRRVSDPNIIKNTIIDEISKKFNPDKCFIALYDSANDSFYFDKYSEHLPSKTLVSFNGIEEDALNFEQFNNLFKSNIKVCFANVEEYIEKNSLKGTAQEKLLREQNIKSFCSIPIYSAGNFFGYVIIQYANEYKELNKKDLSFLTTMATQIGIAINQENRLH